MPQADIVLDCTDNFRTHDAVNATRLRHREPLVWGGSDRMGRTESVYDPSDTDSPCYACLFPPDADHHDVARSTIGLLAPLVGLVGSLQAAQALKLMVGSGESLAGRLLMPDGRGMWWDEMKVVRHWQCAVCAELY